MRTLYIDSLSGISGDMTLGALIDLGADPEYLKRELAKLNFPSEYELTWKKVVKNGISATKFDVILKNEVNLEVHSHKEAHSDHSHYSTHEIEHPHEHNHWHSEQNEQLNSHIHDKTHDDRHHHEHPHSHDYKHSHEHPHTDGERHHSHPHGHRHLTDIIKMIESASFNERVTTNAINMFKAIGQAEAKIHNMSIEKVHFHEVGAVDSIIDIVGTALLIDYLEIDEILASSIPVGSGKINIDHGVYPVPAPATLELLKGVPIQQTALIGELTTPTGAGILAVLVKGFCSFPSMTVEAIGYGAGTKTFPDHPNVLRLVLGTQTI